MEGYFDREPLIQDDFHYPETDFAISNPILLFQDCMNSIECSTAQWSDLRSKCMNLRASEGSHRRLMTIGVLLCEMSSM